jgi:carbamoyl-phosphate synthase small subunit
MAEYAPSHVDIAGPRNMRLELEDGSVFLGRSFGAPVASDGEVVFNTAMIGYPESLTDPSYRGQILVLTYPLQGNYGVADGPFEAERIQVQGLVVSHASRFASHYTSERSLGQWLKSEGVPGLCDVDTRSLTTRLRERGTMKGRIELVGGLSAGIMATHRPKVDMAEVLKLVTPGDLELHVPKQACGLRILMIDLGHKASLLGALLARGVEVLRSPWHAAWECHLDSVDGIFMSNGPGDPTHTGDLPKRVRRLFSLGKPIFGVCMGHQVLGLAAGAKTKKMRYGHRGANQPVQDLLTGKGYISSQNHGYMVDDAELEPGFLPWFRNLNDGSNEGIRHATLPICSVQFHPEGSPGPHDTTFLFDQFVADLKRHKKQCFRISTESSEVRL